MNSRTGVLGPAAAFAALIAAAPASAQYYPYPPPRNPVVDEIARVGAAAADAIGAVNYALQGTQERFAVNACGAQAQRYGRVSIGEVYPKGSRSWRVRGIVEPAQYGQWGSTYRRGYERRSFTCTARNDGTVTKFKTKRLRY
ncbi:MAG TPA: hypothetical protein VF582_09690 [Allosphingosinicella sp.]